ncbi:ribbon-helix-helix domain-containing protein [Kocuria sp. cx-455]
MPRLSICIPAALVQAMDDRRAATGTSRAGFIRLAVAHYLKTLATNGDQA